MNNKRIWLLSSLLIIALLVVELIVERLDIVKFITILFGALLTHFVLRILANKMKENSKSSISKIVFLISMLGCLLFYILSFITKCDAIESFIIMTINISGLLLTQCLLYRGCTKKWGNKQTSIILLLNSVLMLLAYHYYLFDIRYFSFCFPFVLFYFMEYFDYTTIFRKKNIFRLGITLFISIVCCIVSPYLLLACLYAFIVFLIKAKSKKVLPLCFGYAIILCVVSLLCLHFGSANIISAYTFPYPYVEYYSVIILFLLFLMCYHMLENIVQYETYLFLDKSIYILCYAIISILFVSDLVTNLNIIPLILVYICGTMNKNHVFVLDLNKYRKPKNNNVKKVSVAIPNYNYANYIEQRIDSILKQNYPIYELIILDDCSTDHSIEVIETKIKEIRENYPELKIQFIPNEKNSGNVFKQWQKCFEVSTGDYLWICEADDLCSPYFLSAVMKGFQEDVVLSYCESRAIDENGNIFKHDLRDWVDVSGCKRWNRNYIASGKDELANVLCINNTIPNVSGVVFKKNKQIDYIKHLQKAQEFTLSGDWYFYSKVLLQGKIAYYTGSLNYHRMHSKSVTLTMDDFMQYKEILSIQESIQKDIPLSKKCFENIEKRRVYLEKELCISEEEIYYDDVSLLKLVKDKKIKDEVLLSIIIPVYNTELYLKKCLDSILKTLPEKTEIIIINDGSTDHSEKIIKEYEKQYDSIKYIKKANGGLSSVKNRGLKEAKGKYIIFLDSDDYVSSDMYSMMLKKAIDKDADLVYCDMMMVFDDGSSAYCSMTNKNRKDPFLQVLDTPLMATSCNKLVKKELYHDLKFPEEFNNEDIAVTPILIARAKKIEKTELPFYKYVQRSGSIQNSGFSEKRYMVFDAADALFTTMKNECSTKIQEKIEGITINNQLLTILFYLVSKIENKNERLKYIELFCERYNALKVNDSNPYVLEFIKAYKVPKIIHYIKNKDIQKIDRCLRLKF